jgi:hypothetical protein
VVLLSFVLSGHLRERSRDARSSRIAVARVACRNHHARGSYGRDGDSVVSFRLHRRSTPRLWKCVETAPMRLRSFSGQWLAAEGGDRASADVASHGAVTASGEGASRCMVGAALRDAPCGHSHSNTCARIRSAFTAMCQHAPWEGYRHGRGLDTRGLVRLLGEFDVKPRTIRVCGGRRYIRNAGANVETSRLTSGLRSTEDDRLSGLLLSNGCPLRPGAPE